MRSDKTSIEAVFRSRSDQVLDHLRAQIRLGVWENTLPPERQLATQLGIGRGTLRTALEELQTEGLLGERTQRGTRLTAKGGAKTKPTTSIGVVFTSQVELTGKRSVYLDEIRHFFSRKGVNVVVHRAPFHHQRISVHLQRMMTSIPHSLWILVSPTDAIQKWCMQRNLRTMMIGERVEEHGMPAVAIDTRAACRHAVGLMLAKGHRHIALILPIHEKGEDQQSRMGFLEAIEESPYKKEVRGHLEVHKETKESLRRMVDRLVAMKDRPTAWLICRQGHAITIQTYLLCLGIRIPGEISIISRDADIYLNDLEPEPSRYVSNTIRVAQMVARYAQRIIEGKASSLPHGTQLRMVPTFIDGETLGEAPQKRTSVLSAKPLS